MADVLFVIYSNVPHGPTDILLVPASGPPETGVEFESAGVATVTMGMGVVGPTELAFESHGIGHFVIGTRPAVLRVRGRTRIRFDKPYGDLLVRLFSVPQPWEPNIDGDASHSGLYGQFWPRTIKLPFNPVVTPHPNWPQYEYWRR